MNTARTTRQIDVARKLRVIRTERALVAGYLRELSADRRRRVLDGTGNGQAPALVSPTQ